ncbi:site-specific integrase, partial [Kitasatospora sp. NPDC001574]
MPLIVDEDLVFEDESGQRPSTVVNRWACELPLNGCPAARSWLYYVRTVREWMEFAAGLGIGLF